MRLTREPGKTEKAFRCQEQNSSEKQTEKALGMKNSDEITES